MVDIRERQAQRDRVLVAVYELTRGNRLESAGRADLVAATGLTPDEVGTATQWLRDQVMVESMSAAGDVFVTLRGRDRAERLLLDGDQQPVQVTLSIAEQRTLEAFISAAQMAVESSNLAGDDRADAEAQLATLVAQQRSPRPRRDVVGGAIKGLKLAAGAVLSGVIGNAAYAGLLALAA